MVLIKGGQMKQKIIKPGVVRRIAEKIADEGINIPKESSVARIEEVAP